MSTDRAGTTRKVFGSLAVIGTAAAVAGLGTFGTFTDSTTPVSAELTSGTVSIDLAQPAAPIPATTTGLLPGDTLSRTVTLTNDGNSPLSSVTLGVTTPTAGILTTDTVHGLQLSLTSCSLPWTQNGTTAPTYTCSGTTTPLSSGPAVGHHAIDGAASLTPGGADNLLLTLALPESADNRFQGQTSTLNLTFSGIQRAATTR
ncbi:hypothetical protein E4P41_01470 [Geodermatophilus sp. DF01-2]|uniref:TasA family protein n=1 Tax=Geodermatophilus sp. DF01-2 TaxID=2559610 RepID=UPI001073875A|nr:TasA family protein [Geodermatophilus sp. DF01_2]TFV64564.1 hypothetical protein E4P41_01470 [Geodermatophilus sp. DF01_2]